VVVERLVKLGMADTSAIESAKMHGVAPDFVTALISHYEAAPGSWGIGALHFRLRMAAPGQRIQDGWPPPVAQTKPLDAPAEHERLRYLRIRQLRESGMTPEEAVAAFEGG
jgi:hypothetical protein